MEVLRITGGKTLNGEVAILAAKNSVLPLIACSIMSTEDIVINDVAMLSDVKNMLDILTYLGVKINVDGCDVRINAEKADSFAVPCDLCHGIRSSVFILGPLLSRFRRASVSYPGGCEIGLRPIDLHLYGLKRLNVKICEENGYIICDGSEMKSGEIDLDFPSVGATENVMMAAVFLPGRTVIRNAAREPEIVDLADFINSMGGKVYGAGGSTIVIDGVKKLHGTSFRPIRDRIVGGTYMAACACCGGDVFLRGLDMDHVYSTAAQMSRAGCLIQKYSDGVRIRSNGKLRALHKIETQPYPGFPTDMQSQTVAMLTCANGCSVMVENLFENRYKYIIELQKMGANITVKDRIAVIKGVRSLHCACVKAEDLRGGAALVIAALMTEGNSVVGGVEHIDRGYRSIESDLTALGARIARQR